MKAIILAAGEDNELGNLHREITPKCLIEIGGKTLLERQIETLNSCGISSDDIVVVIGGKGEAWSKKNQEKGKRITKNIIINNDNIEKNQSYSLLLALEKIDETMLCIDGDTIFKKGIIGKIINSKYSSVLLAREGEITEKRLRILTQQDKVLEIGKEVKSDKIYTPLLKFDSIFVRALKQELKRGIYFSFTIDVPINALCKFYPIYSVSIPYKNWLVELPTLNINTPNDYKKAQEMFK